MDKISEIVALTGAIVGLVCAALPLIRLFLVLLRDKKKRREFYSFIAAAITEAEENVSGGKEKLAYVLMRVQGFCSANSLCFDATEVVETVEDLIRLSKKVNCQKREEEEHEDNA